MVLRTPNYALPALGVVSPDAAALDRARRVIARSSEAYANLALAGDKQFLFADADAGFVMFQRGGRSGVALGDPVGPIVVHQQLISRFRELCEACAIRPAFYQVSAASLPLYAGVGLSASKLGEEGRVELASFDLGGAHRSDLRQDHRRAQRQGVSFSVLSPADVVRHMDVLRAISDEWLATRAVAEKGFSLGFFDAAYLANFPCAIVVLDGRIVAFGNLLCSGDHTELALDLMRHTVPAPNGLMEFLFVEAMLWGKQMGFRWFNLGMAPLSGLDESLSPRPLWERVGAFLFHHGEHFYNFEGLRRYKEKFAPEWRPRYLASPGGMALPRVLMDVSTLIAGSPRRLLTC